MNGRKILNSKENSNRKDHYQMAQSKAPTPCTTNHRYNKAILRMVHFFVCLNVINCKKSDNQKLFRCVIRK